MAPPWHDGRFRSQSVRRSRPGERTDSGPPAATVPARPIEIAAALREIATALELEGERFRARAYDRAARTIELTPGIADAIREERLLELPGIGPSLARVVEEIASTGTVGLEGYDAV